MNHDQNAPLSSEDCAIIQEEEAIHAAVRAALIEAASQRAGSSTLRDRLLAIREQASTSARVGSDDLPGLIAELYVLQGEAGRAGPAPLPDARAPYFAHMRLNVGGRRREVLVGHQTFSAPAHGVYVIDWRNAPLARVFFHYGEGDEYSETVGDRDLEGVVELRRLVAFEGGQLVRIETPAGTMRRSGDGRWFRQRRAGGKEGDSLAATARERREGSPAPGSAREQREGSPPLNSPRSRGEVGGGPGGEGTGTGTGTGRGAGTDTGAGTGTGSMLEVGLDGPIPFGTGATWESPLPVSALLDSTQYAAIEQDPKQPLLLLGGAGSGKTTVALHRLATLHRRDPAGSPPEAMLVVVPEGGLSRLVEAMLRDLDLFDVPVRTFDRWIVPQAKRVLKDLPSRVRFDAPPSVIRFKRHPAMYAAMEALLARLERELIDRLEAALLAHGRIDALYRQCQGPHLLARVRKLRVLGRKQLPREERKAFLELIDEEEDRLFQLRRDRIRLFGDATLLSTAMEASGGALTPGMMREMLERSRRQLGTLTEHALRHVVDADRLQTVDGRSIDEGTPDELAESIDVEDLPILFEMLRLKTGAMRVGHAALKTCHHLVIDEAQELSPFELSVLSAARDEGSSLTVAGDENQHTDPDSDFVSWEASLSAMRVDASHTIRLETSYRCTAAVLEVAHQVLGPQSIHGRPVARRQGAPVLHSTYTHEGMRAVALVETLERLRRAEPRAQVAIIAATPERAARVYEGLRNQLSIRRVIEGEFSFKPGIEVTDVSQVKGLEFDYVVIPDASREVYPDTPGSRRKLYVAVTRAIHQLWLVSMGERSPLLGG